jgi:L-seryl-tRNA(Ser) seleniumtransferase
LPASDLELHIDVAQDNAPVGGGSLPGAELPTAVLRIKHSDLTADELAARLRLGSPRVFGRVQDNEVVLDLRSVLPDDDDQIIGALNSLTPNEN